MGEFKKRIKSMEDINLRTISSFEAEELIDEARKEFPLLKYVDKELKEGEVYAMSLNEITSILVTQELFEWFVKWFGDS